MKQMKSLSLLMFAAFVSLSAVAQPLVPEPTVENRPFVRWWWLGSAVDEGGITWNLEEFARAGLGGVEIAPIYGVKNNEKNDVEYLSPRWMELYTHTVKEASRLGLQVDLNNGTGWPFGGPDITTDYSAKQFFSRKIEIKARENVDISLAIDDKKQGDNSAVQCVIAVSTSLREDITRFVSGTEKSADGLFKAKHARLQWTSQEDATIYVLYSGHTYQKVKRPAPGGEGLVMNHYSKDALGHYLAKFDKSFSESSSPWPNTFFNDSFEVYGSDWATDLLDEFVRDHGYRLEYWLPEFLGEGNPDTHARIVTDYRQTLAKLLEKNFVMPWMQWAHSHGARVRNQAHGSPANIIDLYALVDIPECETYGRSDFDIPGLRYDPLGRKNDGDPAVLKFASSAAHLTGKKYTSAEALTWISEHFRTSLSQCKPEVDKMFASGVNHLYFQGAPYSPKDAPFPGWKFYATMDMSPANNIWRHAPAFFEYVTNCQTFLADGRPDNDVLLYVPIYDIWHEWQEKQFMIFAIHKMDKTMPKVKKAMNTIVAEGFDADYVSDRLMLSLRVKNGKIVSECGAQYKAIVIPSCHKMPLETLKKLLEFSRKGAEVIFIDHLPDDVPGWSDLEGRRRELNGLLKSLRGRVTVGTDYNSLLTGVGACCEPFKADMGGTLLRQKNNQGGYDYFLAMLTDCPVHGYVELAAELPALWDGTVWVSDPLRGGWSKATHKYVGARLSVYLNLDPGESLLLRIVPQKCNDVPRGIHSCKYETGSEYILDKGWTLSFPESNPQIDDVFSIDSLVYWTSLDDERLKVNCGTGLYRTEFRTPDGEANGWILDLGDVRESAKVSINGKELGTLFSVPFNIYIDSEDLAPPGNMNVLEVEVCNLPSNRIADFDRRGVEWRIFKDANIVSAVRGAKQIRCNDWPIDPSGLTNKVTLTKVL